MPTARYRVFDHTADIGLEVEARTLPELFQTAARALFDQITDIDKVRDLEERHVTAEAAGTEELLVRWLSELLFLHDAEGVIFSRFEVDALSPERVSARVGGEPFDPGRHPVKTEVKAVTYHQVSVIRQADGTHVARFVVDV
jgi:SHS2 domain-containing protein